MKPHSSQNIFLFADLTFSQKMVSNELLLAYSFCVRTREVTNRGLLDMAHLPLSLEIPVEFFSIDATKYGFDTSLRKTITKQVVSKALNETLDTQKFDFMREKERERIDQQSFYKS